MSGGEEDSTLALAAGPSGPVSPGFSLAGDIRGLRFGHPGEGEKLAVRMQCKRGNFRRFLISLLHGSLLGLFWISLRL
jgi:hypothetical protein